MLRGQLLGGGIVLRRGGEDVTLKPEFPAVPVFKVADAGDVLDSFLCWGLCVVAYDEDLDLKRQAQRVATKGSKPEPVLAPMVLFRECIEIAFRQTGKMGCTLGNTLCTTWPGQCTSPRWTRTRASSSASSRTRSAA